MWFMLGNGVKRKLDEDGLEEERRPVAAGSVSQASFRPQRQTVLSMSLMKLYSPRPGARLALQRRVLINNVIRRIHADVRQEGGVSPLFFSSAPPVASTRGDENHPQPPPPPSSFSIFSSSLSALDSCLTPASLLEEDLPMFFTSPPLSSTLKPPPSPDDSFSSVLEEMEEQCPSSSSTWSPPPAQLLFDVVMKEEGGRGFQEVEHRLEKPPPPPSSSSGSFLMDFALDDVLFTDTDQSMYDLGPSSPPSGAPPSKIAPVMMDDLVRSMSGYGAAGAQNQSFKMDLAELDHIMEVLVGS